LTGRHLPVSVNGPALTGDATTVLTDLHIKFDEPHKSLAYPGPRLVGAAERDTVQGLMAKLTAIDRDDFMIDLEGVFWRGRRDARAVDGKWYRLRRMAGAPPLLDALPLPMNKALVECLLSPVLAKGGLVYVCGAPGSGKTTTASAILVSRLGKFGGIGYTVEDPPELPLNGWHGSGYCSQTWVAGDAAADWGESMRGVLRSQPVGTPVMLYVGEVRDEQTARAMLRAAANGFLVVATGFGSDIASGVDAFFQLAGKEHAASLAAALRAVVYQRLIAQMFYASILASASAASRVANLIRAGQIAQLQTEINYQSNAVQRGADLWQTA
jgi:twitching motility protein PilT